MPNTALEDPTAAADGDAYAPYGQLIKMLLPRVGSIALYDADGALLWCSEGYEPPELRELVGDIGDGANVPGRIKPTSAGTSAYVQILRGAEGNTLGSLIFETPPAQGAQPKDSMLAGLLRPVIECLQRHLDLELASSATPASKDDLELLNAIDDEYGDQTETLERFLEHAVAHLDCAAGVLLVPERGIGIGVGGRSDSEEGTETSILAQTHKHLLAWAELNNRPMVINRVGREQRPEVPPYKLLSCPVRDTQERVIGLLAFFRAAEAANFELRDIRLLEFLSRKITRLLWSQHDRLTGLLNRLAFERRVEQVLEHAGIEDAHSLLYFDLDRLQLCNDTFGFSAGDQVLARAGEILREKLTHDDVAARLGGDRFAVFLPATSLTDAEARASEYADGLSAAAYLDGGEAVPVSATIGVADCRGSTVQQALARAEDACKRGKTKGRGRIELAADADGAPATGQHAAGALSGLQHALRNNDFFLDAQAVTGLASGKGIIAWEVLLRMRDPEGTVIAPLKFIAEAERYNLATALDRWVLTSALRTLRQGLDIGADPKLMINVTAQSITGDHYVEFVLAQLADAGVPARMLCFELAESTAVAQLGQAERFVKALVDAGCSVALDDFGRGLTSIAHLRKLSVTYLKLDGGLVRRIGEDQLAESIVAAAAQAGKALGIETIAEHVETETVATRLRELGVDYGQGFFLGRPRSLDAIVAELANPAEVSGGAASA